MFSGFGGLRNPVANNKNYHKLNKKELKKMSNEGNKHAEILSKIKDKEEFLSKIDLEKLIWEDSRGSRIFGMYCDQVDYAIQEYVHPYEGSLKLFNEVVPHIAYYLFVKEESWNSAVYLGTKSYREA
jgi:hypothetical protein